MPRLSIDLDHDPLKPITIRRLGEQFHAGVPRLMTGKIIPPG